MQYNTPLMLWFRYWVEFIIALYSGKLPSLIKYDIAFGTAVGAVRIKNVTETVTTMVVPLVADLLRAWLVDSVELL